MLVTIKTKRTPAIQITKHINIGHPQPHPHPAPSPWPTHSHPHSRHHPPTTLKSPSNHPSLILRVTSVLLSYFYNGLAVLYYFLSSRVQNSRNSATAVFQPGQQLWPGLAWNQAGYIGWTDQARPNFQNSAWTGGLAWQATRLGRQLWSRKWNSLGIVTNY
jgi:hypothetical protein